MEAFELKEAFNALPPLPSVEGDIWTRHRRSIRRHVATSDEPMRFLNWSTIIATMFVGDASYIKHEFESLKQSDDWNRWRNAIQETYLGAPQTLPYYTASSGNLVHQAYHLKKFEDMTGEKLNDMESIFEFGCGYGAMPLVANRAGFMGDYYIHDFPEMILLAIFYLTNLGVGDIQYIYNIEPLNVDLFVACYSLSEIRTGIRSHVLDTVVANNYLFVFQSNWDGIDNFSWFDSFTLAREDLRWNVERVTHFESDNLWYMVGSKR